MSTTSKETAEWLNGGNIIVGMGRKPWWYNENLVIDLGIESPLYDGAIPADDILRRIFNYGVDAYQMWAEKPMVEGWDGPVTEGGTRLVRVDGRKITGPDNRDAFFAPFKDGYNEKNHQFGDILVAKMMDVLAGCPSLGFASAGRLRDGAAGFVSVELPEPVTDGETGMVFAPFVSASSSMDGIWSSVFGKGVTLQVCDNTTDAARGEAEENGTAVKVRHTKYSGLRLDVVRDALGIIETTIEEFSAELHTLAAAAVTDKQWGKMLDLTVPVPAEEGNGRTMAENKRGVLDGLYRHDPRCEPWTGTALGVFQTYSTYGQHLSITRGKAHRAEKNLLEVINGKVADRDAQCIMDMRKVGILAKAS